MMISDVALCKLQSPDIVSQFAEREVELQELPVRIENLLASKVFV